MRRRNSNSHRKASREKGEGRRRDMTTGSNKIILGGLEVGPEDPAPSALVAVSYSTRDAAEKAARMILSLQNGTKPFKSGPPVYVGDTRIRVALTRDLRSDDVLCEVSIKVNPKHLTYWFYAACRVPKGELDTFLELFEFRKCYVFTVAHGQTVLVETLNLIKYTIDRRGV